jgi:CheY-like chemotaxis protein
VSDLAAILVRHGVLSPETLAQALARAQDGDVASAALRLGLASESALVKALASAFSCPGVDLSKSVVPVANLAVLALDWCRQRGALPVTVGRGELVLAMGNPEDYTVADEARFITGRKVLRYVAVAVAVERVLESLERLRRDGGASYRGPHAPALPQGSLSWVGVVHPPERARNVDLPENGPELELVGLAEAFFETPFAVASPAKPRPGRMPGQSSEDASGAGARVEAPTLRVEGAGAGKVALVADDDGEARATAAAALGKLGCTVLQADNGRAALDTAREARPDLTLLEAMMPVMHGFEVCRAIKGDPELRRTQVVLTSGAYRGTVAADARTAFGADAFLEKPFRPDDLARVLRIALVGAAAGAQPAEEAQRAGAEKAWRSGAQALAAGKLEEALELCRQAAAQDPCSAEAHYYLGHALSKQGLLFEAAAAYERSGELRPDVDAAHQYLAQIYEKLGFQKSAREAWARAIETCRDPARKKAMQTRLMKLLGM